MTSDQYLRDIGKVPLLTPEEEIVLGNKVQAMVRLLESKGMTRKLSSREIEELVPGLTISERKVINTGLRARNKIVSANMRLVVAIAKKYIGSHVHMTMQDLMQEGAIGLTRAAEKFDPARGYKFSTYAYLWIKQAMTRGSEAQEGTIKLPAQMQRAVRKAAETRIRLTAKLGRQPSFEEIAEDMGEKDWKKLKDTIMSSPTVFSFDKTVASKFDGTGPLLIETINADDESQIAEDQDNMDRLGFVMLVINALSPEDKKLISQRYGINDEVVPINKISEELGATPQAIRDRQKTIVKKIRYMVTKFSMPTA